MKSDTDDQQQARKAAVALNYCRTSFHRIRRYPSKRVLVEEQEKILNNLNLNGIADEEVIKLYAAVLQEIGEVQIEERERKVIKERHRRVFYRQLSWTLLDLSAEVATAQYASAVRTGATSWWDFRAMGWQTELDTWKVEKDRLISLTGKSTQFLDTFWKLTRKRNIPDNWLVRTTDLDRLEAATREPDLAVRLRVLKRMENFMLCYPPYWYYVGRTQQQLGQLFAAAETYHRLVELGQGHFRKDEMLAAAQINRAVIQQFLKQPSADKTARQALKFSTDVWQVNLLGADVLRRNSHFAEAEDAILRNLDVELERPQSLSALLSLYYHWKQNGKLAELLATDAVIREVPVPVLLETARLLAEEGLPRPLLAHLAESLIGYADLRFGQDDLVFSAAGWQTASARISLIVGERTLKPSDQRMVRDRREIHFRRVIDLGSPLKPSTNDLRLTLVLDYPEGPEVHVHFAREAPGRNNPLGKKDRPSNRFHMIGINVNEQPLPLKARTAPVPSKQPTPPVTPAPPEEQPDPIDGKPQKPPVPQVETLPPPPG